MNPYVLEMKGIEKSFGVPVLKGVDFSLEKGEIQIGFSLIKDISEAVFHN